MLKRNSGFLIGCVLAAGASFFTADILMSDQILLKLPSTEADTETGTVETVAPELQKERTYETDPFTVTSSGNIVKGVETEKAVPQTEAQTDEDGNEITPQTDESGNVITPQTDASGNVISGDGDSEGTGQSGGDSSGGETGYSGEISYSGDDGYYSGGSGGDSSYYAPEIVIQDPGSGDYSYSDGGSGGGSGSGGGGESGGSSSGGGSGSGNSGAWTPEDVIIQGISSRYIDESELYNYNAGQLRLIRNEIFALHGRIFRSQDLMDYFSQRSWYVPTYDPDEFDANMFYYLNDYEEANLKVILNYEAALAGN